MKLLLQTAVESCCDYHGSVLKNVWGHPLLEAVHIAFSEHRPLVLGPDAIWITITQGIANHMVHHGERLRKNFVSHEGRKVLSITVTGWVKGTPENPWRHAFEGWTSQIRENVGAEVHDQLIADFSTTGPTELAASQVVMMDVFERYFAYGLRCVCGIPTVTLEGTTADWEKLREKIEVLERFEMGWWLTHLRAICDEFVNASRGQVNLKHWQGICKIKEQYGGDIVNGWIAYLFPYLGEKRTLNLIFELGVGFQTSNSPSGLSRVPFVWVNETPGTPSVTHEMEALGGFLGVEQNAETKALRPKIGWAVRDRAGADVVFDRLAREHVTRRGLEAPAEFRLLTNDTTGRAVWSVHAIPEDLSVFYQRTNGAEIHVRGSKPRIHIRPFLEVAVAWVPAHKRTNDPITSAGNNGEWMRFCDLPDGRFLTIDSQIRGAQPREVRARRLALERTLVPEGQVTEQRINRGLTRWQRIRRWLCNADKTRAQEQALSEQATRFRAIKATRALKATLETARNEATYPAWLVILCSDDTIGLPGRCPVVAESFTEFLKLALESDKQYWWERADWVPYGDAFEYGTDGPFFGNVNHGIGP